MVEEMIEPRITVLEMRAIQSYRSRVVAQVPKCLSSPSTSALRHLGHSPRPPAARDGRAPAAPTFAAPLARLAADFDKRARLRAKRHFRQKGRA